MLLTGAETLQPDEDRRLSVLVVCTGNSARSIMAEALFNSVGGTLFVAHSAGSKPVGRVNPLALEQIAELGSLPGDYSSKSWLEFTRANAPQFDVILTVCANAQAETCPTFGGDYQHVHWGLPDPAAVTQDTNTAQAAFAACFTELSARIRHLVDHCFDSQEPLTIINLMRELGLNGEQPGQGEPRQ